MRSSSQLPSPKNLSAKVLWKDRRPKDPLPSNPSLAKWIHPCQRPKILRRSRSPTANSHCAIERAGNLRSKGRSEKIPRRWLALRSSPRREESLPSCPCCGGPPCANLHSKDRLRAASLCASRFLPTSNCQASLRLGCL